MKKIVTAVSALAVVGVIAPATAEVNISAYYEFGWASISDDVPLPVVARGPGYDPAMDNRTADGRDSHTFQNSEIHFSFSKVADTGVEFGAKWELEGVADGQVSVDTSGTAGVQTVNTRVMDESSVYIKGDFGKIIFGQDDNAHDSFLTWSPTHRGSYGQDDNHYYPRFLDGSGGTIGSHVTGNNPSYADQEKVIYMSPNFSGFKLGASWTDGNANDGSDEGADASYGLSYSVPEFFTGLSIDFTLASYDDGEPGRPDNSTAGTVVTQKNLSSNSYGVTVGFHDLTLTGSIGNQEQGLSEIQKAEYGIGYDISDVLSVGGAYTIAEDDNNGHQQTLNTLSALYTISPGLSTAVSYNTFEIESPVMTNNNEGSVVVLSLQADF